MISKHRIISECLFVLAHVTQWAMLEIPNNNRRYKSLGEPRTFTMFTEGILD